jgi:hypothetical protein
MSQKKDRTLLESRLIGEGGYHLASSLAVRKVKVSAFCYVKFQFQSNMNMRYCYFTETVVYRRLSIVTQAYQATQSAQPLLWEVENCKRE